MTKNPLRVDITEIPEGETELTGAVAAEDLAFTDEEVRIQGSLTVRLRLQKLGPKILADGTVGFSADLMCGRCLENFQTPLTGHMMVEYVPAGAASREEGADVELVVPYNGKVVDLSDDIRQTVVLAIPLKKVCRNECRGLCPTCGMNLNKGGHLDHG